MPDYSLYIQPGETKRLTVEWQSGGVAVDLAGCASILRIYGYDGSLLYTFDSATAAITLGAGTLALWIPDETTALMVACKSYIWAVEHPNGDVTHLLVGPVAFGQPGKSQEGVIRVDHEKITILNLGVQGVPGPAGADIDTNFELTYETAKL